MSEQTEYQVLLREAYRGEFFGEGFFGALAEKQPDPDRREKLETLTTSGCSIFRRFTSRDESPCVRTKLATSSG